MFAHSSHPPSARQHHFIIWPGPGPASTPPRAPHRAFQARARMSQARQPFSRGGIVSGVNVKKAALKHPPELDRRVDMARVKWEVVKPWIATRVTELLTIEDDVLIAMIYNLLEQEKVHKSGAAIYGQLLTFLEKNTATFMKVRSTRVVVSRRSHSPHPARSPPRVSTRPLITSPPPLFDRSLFAAGAVGSSRQRRGEPERRPSEVHRRESRGASSPDGRGGGTRAAQTSGGAARQD